jgi:hypothetical protein
MPQRNVDYMISHAIYDPAARRERYLKTRQLKGRQKAGEADPNARPDRRTVRVASSRHAQANRAASQARQVAAFRERLTNLRAQLEKLLASAGTTSKTSSSSSKSGSSSAKGKPMTAKEKADARKASEKYRKEHPTKKTDTPDKTAPTKEEQIKHLRAVIADVESKLRAAIVRAQTQTASNGR